MTRVILYIDNFEKGSTTMSDLEGQNPLIGDGIGKDTRDVIARWMGKGKDRPPSTSAGASLSPDDERYYAWAASLERVPPRTSGKTNINNGNVGHQISVSHNPSNARSAGGFEMTLGKQIAIWLSASLPLTGLVMWLFGTIGNSVKLDEAEAEEAKAKATTATAIAEGFVIENDERRFNLELRKKAAKSGALVAAAEQSLSSTSGGAPSCRLGSNNPRVFETGFEVHNDCVVVRVNYPSYNIEGKSFVLSTVGGGEICNNSYHTAKECLDFLNRHQGEPLVLMAGWGGFFKNYGPKT